MCFSCRLEMNIWTVISSTTENVGNNHNITFDVHKFSPLQHKIFMRLLKFPGHEIFIINARLSGRQAGGWNLSTLAIKIWDRTWRRKYYAELAKRKNSVDCKSHIPITETPSTPSFSRIIHYWMEIPETSANKRMQHVFTKSNHVTRWTQSKSDKIPRRSLCLTVSTKFWLTFGKKTSRFTFQCCSNSLSSHSLFIILGSRCLEIESWDLFEEEFYYIFFPRNL